MLHAFYDNTFYVKRLNALRRIEYGCATHVGLVRSNNEDSYIAEPALGLWLVADGMGGHESGEIASAIVTEHVVASIQAGTSLEKALLSSHNAILNAPDVGRGERGMGSTAVGISIDGTHFHIAWVGDSRAYFWNNSSLNLLTHDHSVVQKLIDAGAISPAEAESHPASNVLTQAIGFAGITEINVSIIDGVLKYNDRILLCSDGLNRELADSEIEAVFSKSISVQATADLLVQSAIEHGGSDNVTAIVLSYSTR